jgi:hypothetical protein
MFAVPTLWQSLSHTISATAGLQDNKKKKWPALPKCQKPPNTIASNREIYRDICFHFIALNFIFFEAHISSASPGSI